MTGKTAGVAGIGRSHTYPLEHIGAVSFVRDEIVVGGLVGTVVQTPAVGQQVQRFG